MSLITYYSSTLGPGFTAPQITPADSLGGYTSITRWGGGALNDLFGTAAAASVTDGRADYRALYLYNDAPDVTIPDLKIYVAAGTDGAEGVAVGVDPRPASYLDSLSPQGVEIASVWAAPAGVVFSSPTTYAAGEEIGDLPPTAGKMVWIKRVPLGSAGGPADYVDIIFEASDETTIVRRIYWETAPYAETTRPTAPPNATASPAPFRRVTVDFLTLGGSRITWDLDRAFDDDGPYVFQLQFSHSGIATGGDWVDVGPPAEDVLYLLDPDQRLWGAGLTTAHYRILLTTADASYTSQAAPLFGRLDMRSWSMVREMLRKEQLMLRQFVGQNGSLLRARRYGTICSCTDAYTGEIGNSTCTICYGNKYEGGFYPPVPLRFANPANTDAEEKVEYNEGTGTVRRVTVFGRVTADVVVASRDVWVSEGEDERFYVHKVKEVASFRGQPIIYLLELRRAPESDIIYSFPVTRPEDPDVDWRTEEIITV